MPSVHLFLSLIKQLHVPIRRFHKPSHPKRLRRQVIPFGFSYDLRKLIKTLKRYSKKIGSENGINFQEPGSVSCLNEIFQICLALIFGKGSLGEVVQYNQVIFN